MPHCGKSTIAISVIIPVYKAEKYIEECINSVLIQNFTNFEIIVIDDGSPDKSGEVCDKLAANDCRIKVIHQQNAGVSVARNVGIKAAKGEYICFVDSDDKLTDDALKYMYDNIGEADLFVGNLLMFGTDLPTNIKTESFSGTEFIKRCSLNESGTASACAKLYKTEFIKNLRFPEGYRYTEDNFFIFTLAAKQPKVILSNKCVYLIRPNLNSATRSNMDKIMYDVLDLAQKKYDIIMDKYPEYEKQAKHILIKAKLLLLDNMVYSKGYFKKSLSLRKEIIASKEDFISRGEKDDKRIKRLTDGFFGYCLWVKLYVFYRSLKNLLKA